MKTSAVLFDLDGTLADTAPDLGDTLNHLLVEEGRAALPPEEIRKYASFGAAGLLARGFGKLTPDETARLTARFLKLYEQNLCNKTRLFPGVFETLRALEKRGVAWSVATNKSRRFAEPLLRKLGLPETAAGPVCGDMVKYKKPAPDLLLLAAERLRVNAPDCLYVGDSERDAKAAGAAAMPVLIVAYGYESSHADTDTWSCDGVVERLIDVIAWVDESGGSGPITRSP